jgi:ABC-type sugar transport system ATPase subunit
MKKLGLGLTPENRKEEGLILIHSVLDNLCYASMDKTSNGWLENKQKRKAAANKQIQELDIKITDINASLSTACPEAISKKLLSATGLTISRKSCSMMNLPGALM